MIVTFSLFSALLQFNFIILNLAETKNVDIIGNFDLLFEKQLGEVVKASMVIDEATCKPKLLEIGVFQVFSSSIPLGVCDYCCPLKKRHHYVKPYFFQNCTSYKIIHRLEKGSLRDVGFNSALPTVMYVHGFGEGALTPNSKLLCNAYFSGVETHNVIFIDWSELSTIPWYQQAVHNIDYVKKIVTNFITFYIETGEIVPSNLHIIGFSLGAQIAGEVGKNFQETNKIARITGLDPAFPSFSLIDNNRRLSKGDALYVDIIHTDAGKFGFPISIGDVDFYPNGGHFPQPGCLNQTNTYGACDHMRAIELYAESVKNPEAFPVQSHDGIVYMGLSAMNSKAIGDIILDTNDHSPYGINNKTV